MPQPQPSSQLWQEFAFLDIIGEGQYGKVWRCVERASGQPMACKQIRTSGLFEPEVADLQREIYSLSLLGSHENILSLARVYADDKALYLVTELCDGGDLFDLIDQSPNGLDEETAAKIFVQIIGAIRWCHVHRIVHRDIKPENILLTRRSSNEGATTGSASSPAAFNADDISVRLADFGLAFQLKPGCSMIGVGGSVPYEAPEMLAQQPYNTQADIWSLGVLLYSMLTATWPAFPANRRQLTPNDFRSAGWARLSIAARDLICRMMIVDPAMRIDIDGVLLHPWLAQARRTSLSASRISRQQQQPQQQAPVQPRIAPATVPLTQHRQSSLPSDRPRAAALASGNGSAVRSSSTTSKRRCKEERDAAASLLELVVRSLQTSPPASALKKESPAVSPGRTHPAKIPRTGDSTDNLFATASPALSTVASASNTSASFLDLRLGTNDLIGEASSVCISRVSLRFLDADSSPSISASSSASSSATSEFFTPISSSERRQKPAYHQFFCPRPSLLGVQL